MHDIYFDNAATTRPFPEAAELVAKHIAEGWHNPSAMYGPAVRAEAAVSHARGAILTAAGAHALVFTAGGTEANNLCIFKGWRRRGNRRMHFITSAYEHPAVYEPFRQLTAMGHAVDIVRPGADGLISPADVASLVREDTALVSIMHVNNETGALNDVAEIARCAKRRNPNLLFHSDGVQGFLKADIKLSATKIDYYTVSAHKVHGLKGIGALLMRKDAPLSPLIHGGGQERGLRSGTENTAGIVVFGAAVERFAKDRDESICRMRSVTSLIRSRLGAMEGVRILTPDRAAPHIVCASIAGVRGETLLHALEERGIYISTGSACSAKKAKESRIKQALGLTDAEAEGVIRISASSDSTERQAHILCDEIAGAVDTLRRFVRR